MVCSTNFLKHTIYLFSVGSVNFELQNILFFVFFSKIKYHYKKMWLSKSISSLSFHVIMWKCKVECAKITLSAFWILPSWMSEMEIEKEELQLKEQKDRKT